MTTGSRRISLAMTAIVSALLLAFVLTHRDVLLDPVAPKDDVARIGHWLTQHPADAIAASELSDLALDSNVPQRRALWLASYEHAAHLSPLRTNAAAGFVRAGLFHWYELDDRDRQRVLDVAAPLMGRPRFFERLYMPLWSLTHNFAYLRRVAPRTLSALVGLNQLAVSRGLFREYRELRTAIRQRSLAELEAARANDVEPSELLKYAPQTPNASDVPIAKSILEELDRRPFTHDQINGRIEPMLTFALDHDLKPLGGIEPLLETRGTLRDVTRARAALALGNATLASRIEITTEIPGHAEWTPYHLERAIHDARSGDAASAQAQLRKAEMPGSSAQVVEAKLQVATILGDRAAMNAAQNELASFASQPVVWTNTCGGNDVCDWARTQRYFANGETMRIAMLVAQSDETPPYVEIYVDDALVAEGEVRVSKTFEIKPGEGVKTIDVRLVNRLTRNGIQRRVRLS